jgi:hypothetical protein
MTRSDSSEGGRSECKGGSDSSRANDRCSDQPADETKVRSGVDDRSALRNYWRPDLATRRRNLVLCLVDTNVNGMMTLEPFRSIDLVKRP